MKFRMKEIIKRSIKKYFIRSATRKNNKIIISKIKFLIGNDEFKRFPFREVTPSIEKYSFFRRSDLLYFDFFYSVSGIKNPDYISLPIYYNYLEPALNNIVQLKAIKDKNFIDIFLDDIATPETYLRKMNGAYYDISFNPLSISDAWINRLSKLTNRLILKPSIETGAGKSILLFKEENGVFVDKTGARLNVSLLNSYLDFVLQEVIDQHEFYSKFNPTSNNTIRIFTYRSVKDENIVVLHRLLRIGKSGEFLDHDNHGGIAIGISDDSKLNDFGCSVIGEKYDSFNGIVFEELNEVPFVEEMERIACDVAAKIYYGRVLAFDFTVSKHGKVLLLEINAWRMGISQYQMNNGPLFRSYTKEVLDYCNANLKSYSIII